MILIMVSLVFMVQPWINGPSETTGFLSKPLRSNNVLAPEEMETVIHIPAIHLSVIREALLDQGVNRTAVDKLGRKFKQELLTPVATATLNQAYMISQAPGTADNSNQESRTPAISRTPTKKPAATMAHSSTAASTPTQTPSRIWTGTSLPSNTATFTQVSSTRVTNIPSHTMTPTQTQTISPTPTRTSTVTLTATSTSTFTITEFPVSTQLPNPTKTSQPAASLTPTLRTLVTLSQTPTPSPTLTPSDTREPTPVPTSTSGITQTATGTTPPATTQTSTRTPTNTSAVTATPFETSTPTQTPVPDPTETRTPSLTLTPILTSTAVPTITQTPIFVLTNTPTDLPTATLDPNSCILPAMISGLLPSDDTTIYRVKADTNYGNELTIDIRPENSADMFGLFRFDLSMIPAGAQIQDAKLYLYTEDAHHGQVSSIYRISTPWNELDATWNSPWITPGGDYDEETSFGSFFNNQPGCFTQVELTSLVNLWVNGTYENYGFMIKASGPRAIVHYVSSEEESRPELRPRLSISYTIPGE